MGGRSPEEIQARNAYCVLQNQYNTIRNIKLELHSIEMALVNIYSCLPYDSDELRRLTIEILGDPSVADEMAEDAQKEIAAREGWKAHFK